MRCARIGRLRVRLAGALDRLQREQELAVAGRRGELLDRVAIAVAAAEVHSRVDGRGIALQHLLDQADAFEELAPVEGANQPEAADEIGDARLLRGFVLSLGADRVFDRLAARRERAFELVVQSRRDGAEPPRALQQPRDEGVMRPGRPFAEWLGMRFGCRGNAIGGAPMRACLRQHITARAQVLEQRELQHARPRPELAHRQRRHRLKGADEALQPLRVEPAGARPDQLEGKGMDARQPGVLVCGDARQTAEIGRREIALDVARRGGCNVEVIEQPLGSRRHRLAARVLCEKGVGLRAGPACAP